MQEQNNIPHLRSRFTLRLRILPDPWWWRHEPWRWKFVMG